MGKKVEKGILHRLIIVVILICFGVFLYFFNQVDKAQLINREGTSYVKAEVVNIVQDNIQDDGSRTGYQIVKVKILQGEYKGEEIEATSASGYLYGADCKEGMTVVVNLSVSGETKVASVFNYNREPMIIGFVVFFLALLVAVGGKKGLFSGISLIFTFICIIFLFLPMLYKGYSPFLSAVLVVVLTTIVTMYLIGGISKKTISSILGTVIGVVIAGLFAQVFGYFAHIDGYNVSEIEELVFIANNSELQIGGLLFAGILISSLGAVMDVSMSVASTINEIHDKNPDLSRYELFKSGINVGRDMMGTMSNTLILAFTGGSINTLIWFYAYDLSYGQIINMYQIGIEVMQGLSGTSAIILTVPIVALISSFLLTTNVQIGDKKKAA